MDRKIYLGQVSKQRAIYEKKSPTYGTILSAIEGRLRGGEPVWFGKLSKTWNHRPFSTDYEPVFLVPDMLHFWALSGRGPEIRAHFLDCGGKLRPDTGARMLEFLDAAPDEFWSRLAEARLQTNEISRSVGWMLVACVGFGTRATPFHLVDMGTSAGLNLIGDCFPRSWALRREDGEAVEMPDHWSKIPFPVLSRTGLDAHPRDLENPADRNWLKACVWPDETDRHERFEKAADLFLKLRRDASGPKLVRCDFLDMPEYISEHLRPHSDEGLLIFNSQAVDFLPDADYSRLAASIARILAPWGDRAFWAELELPRDKSSGFHQLTVHRLIDGRLESKVLASMTTHPTEVRIYPGWDFLRPLAPVMPPKITREEPIKNLEPGLYKFPKN